MTILDGIILGIIQGFTEFIPVSSSGHLILGQHMLGLAPSPVFDVLINQGTFLALLIYFRRRIWEIALKIFRDHDFRLAVNILVTAVPVGLAGFYLSDYFSQPFWLSPWIVVTTLVTVGLLMIFVDYLPKASSVDTPERLTPKRAGFIGILQALALIPGVSRSGITMIGGRIAGLTYAQAAEYSFLVSLPVMAGVVAKGLVGHSGRDFIAQHTAVWAFSNLAAFICGLFAVGFMIRFLARGNFKVFGYYRLVLAAVVIITLVAGR